MLPAGRLGDKCFPFPPLVNAEGSPNVFINSLPATRVGDKANIPIFIHVTGSPKVFINSLPAVRVFDALLIPIPPIFFQLEGSPNVFID